MIVPLTERLSHFFKRKDAHPGIYSKVYARRNAKGRITQTTWVMGEFDKANNRYTLYNCAYTSKILRASYRKEKVSPTFNIESAIEAVAEVEYNLTNNKQFSEVRKQPFARSAQLAQHKLDVNIKLGASRR